MRLRSLERDRPDRSTSSPANPSPFSGAGAQFHLRRLAHPDRAEAPVPVRCRPGTCRTDSQPRRRHCRRSPMWRLWGSYPAGPAPCRRRYPARQGKRHHARHRRRRLDRDSERWDSCRGHQECNPRRRRAGSGSDHSTHCLRLRSAAARRPALAPLPGAGSATTASAGAGSSAGTVSAATSSCLPPSCPSAVHRRPGPRQAPGDEQGEHAQQRLRRGSSRHWHLPPSNRGGAALFGSRRARYANQALRHDARSLRARLPLA